MSRSAKYPAKVSRFGKGGEGLAPIGKGGEKHRGNIPVVRDWFKETTKNGRFWGMLIFKKKNSFGQIIGFFMFHLTLEFSKNCGEIH